ncbi:MAG: alpha/beta hydrolase family protein, partial [Candidatus Hydrogenedentes bacterium]|nr:alpha/beta hydrolase family protein [Candidatus Hydrogenedentota bacterium]
MKNTFHRAIVAFILLVLTSPAAFAEPILLEVEDFKGPWNRQSNIPGFLGKGFCTSNAKDPKVAASTMDGRADIGVTGVYAVWTRGYSSKNSDRAYQLRVGETTFPPTHTNSLDAWSWEKAGEIALAAGAVNVSVIDVGEGFESVDAIMLTRDLAIDPDAVLGALRDWLVYPDGLPEGADALRFNIEASRKALALRTDPKTAAEWEARAPKVKAALQKGLGLSPWPEKTPLNATITGRAERDFYFVENLVFESRPNFYVTANVYVPKNVTFPAPAVVVVPGHAMDDGKNYGLYQMGELGMVKEGIIVLAYDPIGQGERKLPGFKHDLGYGSLLVGQTNEGYIVWDTIRAIDYLMTREEV